MDSQANHGLKAITKHENEVIDLTNDAVPVLPPELLLEWPISCFFGIAKGRL